MLRLTFSMPIIYTNKKKSDKFIQLVCIIRTFNKKYEYNEASLKYIKNNI